MGCSEWEREVQNHDSWMWHVQMRCVLDLLLADNYNHTTNDFTTETFKNNSWQSSASLSLRGRRQQRSVAARPWLPGKQDCARGRCDRAGPSGLAAWSSERAGGRSAHDHGFTRRRYSREAPMRKGQFFSRALGPRRWSLFLAKVIRGQGVVRQAGSHVHVLALGGGRPVGPERQVRLPPERAIFRALD